MKSYELRYSYRGDYYFIDECYDGESKTILNANDEDRLTYEQLSKILNILRGA